MNFDKTFKSGIETNRMRWGTRLVYLFFLCVIAGCSEPINYIENNKYEVLAEYTATPATVNNVLSIIISEKSQSNEFRLFISEYDKFVDLAFISQDILVISDRSNYEIITEQQIPQSYIIFNLQEKTELAFIRDDLFYCPDTKISIFNKSNELKITISENFKYAHSSASVILLQLLNYKRTESAIRPKLYFASAESVVVKIITDTTIFCTVKWQSSLTTDNILLNIDTQNKYGEVIHPQIVRKEDISKFIE